MPVKLQGADALRKALKAFEPNLAKAMTDEISSFLKPVARQARGYMPGNAEVPSGWLQRKNAKGRWATRFYDQAIAKRGITYRSFNQRRNRSGFIGLASLFNRSAGGAIYETAGRKSGVVGNFTPRLGGKLTGDKQKMTGRAMFRAFEEDKGKAVDGVVKAIEKAANKFDAMKDKV